MRSRFKSWAKPYLESHPEFVLEDIKKDDGFFKDAPLSLEIGSGKGGFLLQIAEKNPERHYLALERDISICGTFAKKIEEKGLSNIRLLPGDFDNLFEMIKDLRFDEIFLNFSDPWPKKRHAKRRLTTASRLINMDSLLNEEGLIKIKTDNDVLYEFTLEEGNKTPLKLLSSLFDYDALDRNDAESEYEANFRSLHKPIHRIIYQKQRRI